MLLDEFLPAYDFHEFHELRVSASASCVYRALKELTLDELPVAATLMGIRSLPARLAGRRSMSPVNGGSLLEVFVKSGFLVLAEQRNCEIVLGRIGQFWKLAGGESPSIADSTSFVAFRRPGFVKVATNLAVEEQPDGSTNVSTETRIAAIDAGSRRKFGAYWAVIYPWSALIRRQWLRAISRRALRASA
jgi:hypothetical protein